MDMNKAIQERDFHGYDNQNQWEPTGNSTICKTNGIIPKHPTNILPSTWHRNQAHVWPSPPNLPALLERSRHWIKNSCLLPPSTRLRIQDDQHYTPSHLRHQQCQLLPFSCQSSLRGSKEDLDRSCRQESIFSSPFPPTEPIHPQVLSNVSGKTWFSPHPTKRFEFAKKLV